VYVLCADHCATRSAKAIVTALEAIVARDPDNKKRHVLPCLRTSSPFSCVRVAQVPLLMSRALLALAHDQFANAIDNFGVSCDNACITLWLK
jgi:hypothetical protein